MVELIDEEKKDDKDQLIGEEAPPKPKVVLPKKEPPPMNIPTGSIFGKKKQVRKGKKLSTYLFYNFLLILFGLFWIDFLGLVNLKKDVYPVLGKIPVINKLMPGLREDRYLLSREEYKKQQQSDRLYEDVLKQKDIELKNKESQLKSKEDELIEAKKGVEEKEKKIDAEYNKYKDYQQNVRLQADYIVSMPPVDAVSRLNKMEDLLIIDILRQIENKAQEEGKKSIVPYLLTLMEPERASVLQRKMTEY